MTARAARVFLPTLREVERELTVPIPDRVRILRELEFDLEELRGRFEAEGLQIEEARVRALEVLVPDRRTLIELGRVHSPLYTRSTRRLSDHSLRIVERSALALATAIVVLAETQVLLGADLLGGPSPFIWPVLGLGAVLFAVILAKAFGVWVKGDHRVSADGLRGILALAGATLAAGVGGTLIDFYRLAAVLEKAPELAETLAIQWLVRDSALLSVSILLALSGALAWFTLTQWFTLVSWARRDVLGLGQTLHP